MSSVDKHVHLFYTSSMKLSQNPNNKASVIVEPFVGCVLELSRAIRHLVGGTSRNIADHG